MKTMKYYLMAVCVCFLASCTMDNYDNPVEPVPDGPTAKEKAMVPAMMRWQLDSVLIINNPGTLIETYQMLYAGQDTYQWTYTFYPCTYQFPDDLVFYSEFDGDAFQMSKEYNEDYCKYTCTVGEEIISAGYLFYYRDTFAMRGMQQGGWVDYRIREASTDWNTDVWTCTYDAEVELDGTVLERDIEYYSPVK